MGKEQNQTKGFSNFALFLYQCIAFLFTPLLFFVHWRQGAKIARFKERFGFGLSPQTPAPVLWFHAASLGEVKQIEHLAKKLNKTHGYSILITTFTNAGSEWVSANLPFATHQFAPFDIAWILKRFLRHHQPEQLLIIENDIWPCLMATTKTQGCPIAIINARSSSSRRQRSWFHLRAMNYVSWVSCPSFEIFQEFLDLGFPAKAVHQVETLKYAPLSIDVTFSEQLRCAAEGRKIWVAASTHSSDEIEVLAALRNLNSENQSTFLIWAPRHASRVKAIETQLSAANHSFEKRSDGGEPTRTDVYILDSLGELASALSVADLVYLGGGLGQDGGHNPYEPVQLQKPTLSGPNIASHQNAFDDLQSSGLITFVETGVEISQFVINAKRQPVVGKRKSIPTKNIDQTIQLILVA